MDLGSSGSEDSKSFVKLKDKESVRGVFRGDVHKFRQHWVGMKSEVCTGTADCPGCKAQPNKKPAFRFRLNMVVKEGEGYVAKIFEGGWTTFEQLIEINKEIPLENHLVKISRSGTGMDTTYTVIALPNGTVTPEQEAKLKQVTLLDLRPGVENKPEAASPDQAPFTEDDSDIPF